MTDVAVNSIRRRTATRDDSEAERRLEQHRGELTGYCYRMLGSPFEADDAVQDTMVRAWRGLDRFEDRSTLRSWLYRIATNVCLDMLRGRKRRALPVDLVSSSPPILESLGAPLADSAWIEPMPDDRLAWAGDPAELAVSRESVRLAFVAALQHLPPRQRAVLILRDVLRWKADEVAVLLDASVASVNSALQRARSTLADRDLTTSEAVSDVQQQLLARYVDAFQRYDIDALVALLHEDATMTMPPYALWLQGRADIATWLVGPGKDCRGSHWVQVMANGSAAFAQYRPSGPGGGHEPWALHLAEVAGDRISAMVTFLDTGRLFPLFGLPLTISASAQ